jgi:Ethanolamine ammonia lyase large subunit (EutB)
MRLANFQFDFQPKAVPGLIDLYRRKNCTLSVVFSDFAMTGTLRSTSNFIGKYVSDFIANKQPSCSNIQRTQIIGRPDGLIANLRLFRHLRNPMPYHHSVGSCGFAFAHLRTIMARASPLHSGDQLAGTAAADARERVVAQMALADVPLSVFLNEAVVPYLFRTFGSNKHPAAAKR